MMKHLVQYIQEGIFDQNTTTSPYVLSEISLKFFEKMMNTDYRVEWNNLVFELKKYLAKTKVDTISFKEYTDKTSYENGVMTIVPLVDMSSVVICYKFNNRYMLYELRSNIVGGKLFPSCYFWGLSTPSAHMLPDYLFREIKANTSHNLYKITFTETELNMFNKIVKRK